MADLGAEVIKVEDPASPDSARDYGPFPNDVPDAESSGLYAYLNANKLGITLDLHTATGRNLFRELIADADAVLDADPARPLRRLGLGYSELRRVNQQLVHTCVTPFGLTGPYADYKANDMVACHASGTGHRQIGYPDREPLRASWYHADHWGAANAATATMIALEARVEIGRGQLVDLSEAESLAALFVSYNNIGIFRERGATPRRPGARWPGSIIGILPCKDGYVFLMMPDDHMWAGFVEVMGNPEWATDPLFAQRSGRSEHSEEVLDLIEAWLADQTKEDVFMRSQANRAPNTAIYNIDEILDHRHLHAREYFVDLPMPRGGTYKAPGPPHTFPKCPWELRTAAPTLGRHNEAVLCGRLGLSKANLVALGRMGVI